MNLYYESVSELPLFNWVKINEGKFNYCRKDLDKGSDEEDLKHFEIITDDNYKQFGVPKDYARLLEIQLELSEFKLEWVITGDNFLKNKIRMLEEEMADVVGKDDGSDIYDTLITLSKWIGYRIDIKTVTVKEYRKMITLLKREVESSKKK